MCENNIVNCIKTNIAIQQNSWLKFIEKLEKADKIREGKLNVKKIKSKRNYSKVKK